MSDMEVDSPHGSDIENECDSESNSHVSLPDSLISTTETEEQEYLEKFIKNNWRGTIMKARRGDLRALQALSVCTPHMPTSEGPGFCETLCFHFQAGPPESGANENITDPEQLAIVAMLGIGEVLYTFTGGDLEKLVQKSWKDITRWFLFFDKKYVVHGSRNSLCLAVSMTVLLAQATKFEGIRRLVCSDKSLIYSAVRLWNGKNPLYVDRNGLASRALAQCGRFSDVVRETITDLVIGLNFAPTVVSLKILDRITNACRYGQINWTALDGYAQLIWMFSSAPPKSAGRIQVQLSMDDFIWDLNKLMYQRLVEAFPSPDHHDYQSACSAMTKFITFSIYAFEQTYGTILAELILLDGFLKVLIEFSPFVAHEPLRSSFCGVLARTLTETLPRHLGVYSLLNSFKDSVLSGYTEVARERIKNSPVAKEWAIFEGFLIERLAYKALFDDNQDKEKKRLWCGNPDCEKVDDTNSFKVCSACKAERYCSQACQITAWKHKGHKQKCKKKDSKYKAKDEKNEEFVLYCVRRDAIRHLPGLRQLVKHKFGDIDFSSVGVGIDYTTLPTMFEVYRLTTLLDQIAKHEPRLERRLTRLTKGPQEGANEVIFVRAVLPEGKGHTKTIHVEVSLTAADAFMVPEDERPSLLHASKRPVGHYRVQKPLEVVAFDKADQYIAKNLQFDSDSADMTQDTQA